MINLHLLFLVSLFFVERDQSEFISPSIFEVKFRICAVFITYWMLNNVCDVAVITCMRVISKLDLMRVSSSHVHLKLPLHTHY